MEELSLSLSVMVIQMMGKETDYMQEGKPLIIVSFI